MVIRFTLALYGLMLLGFGIAFVIAPVEIARMVDLEARSGLAVMELRAFYGGIEIGLGTLFLVAVFRPSLQRAALIALGSAFAGIVLGRLVGLVLDDFESTKPYWFLLTEVLAGVLAALGLRSSDRAKPLPGPV